MRLTERVEQRAVLLELGGRVEHWQVGQRRHVGRVDRGGDLPALARQPRSDRRVLRVAQDAAGNRLTLDPLHHEARAEAVAGLEQQHGPGHGDSCGRGRHEQGVLGGPVGCATVRARVAPQHELVLLTPRAIRVEQPGFARRATGHAPEPVDAQIRSERAPERAGESVWIRRCSGQDAGRYSDGGPTENRPICTRSPQAGCHSATPRPYPEQVVDAPPRPRTIAVIEDEVPIASAVAARLRSEGYRVEVASDGAAGVELCERTRPDLVVLDLMLPGIDGLEVCRRIQRQRATPVLMLTARDSETDLVIGLGVGADDYMTKPFSARELVARVGAILRRSDRVDGEVAEQMRVGDVDIDPGSRRVRCDGEPVHLTPTEFDLLAYLAARPSRVATREELLEQVWGYDVPSGARTVDSHVRSLRRKLGPSVVRTVHGVGYAAQDSES